MKDKLARGDDLKRSIARRGMFFMHGKPPVLRPDQLDVLLVWTGGCNCIPIYWSEKNKNWLKHGQLGSIFHDFDQIIFWMRMPHPSFWPDIKVPEDLMADDELYHGGIDWAVKGE